MNNLVRSFQYFFFFTKPSSLSTLMLLIMVLCFCYNNIYFRHYPYRIKCIEQGNIATLRLFKDSKPINVHLAFPNVCFTRKLLLENSSSYFVVLSMFSLPATPAVPTKEPLLFPRIQTTNSKRILLLLFSNLKHA